MIFILFILINLVKPNTYITKRTHLFESNRSGLREAGQETHRRVQVVHCQWFAQDPKRRGEIPVRVHTNRDGCAKYLETCHKDNQRRVVEVRHNFSICLFKKINTHTYFNYIYSTLKPRPSQPGSTGQLTGQFICVFKTTEPYAIRKRTQAYHDRSSLGDHKRNRHKRWQHRCPGLGAHSRQRSYSHNGTIANSWSISKGNISE